MNKNLFPCPEGTSDSENEGEVRPEAKYKGSVKHGVKWKEGKATAKKTGKPQGQWSEEDLKDASEKSKTLAPGESGYFDLPEDSTSVVHLQYRRN